MIPRSIAATLLNAATMLAASGLPPAEAARIKGTCDARKMSFTTSTTGSSSTDSSDFVAIPDTAVDFNIPAGTGRTCIVVTFSAETCTLPERALRVRAVLDGSKPGLPASVQFAADENFCRTHSFQFVFRNVTPGDHMVRMQYAAIGGAGATATVHSRMTVVYHR